jgi:hypothetical protein
MITKLITKTPKEQRVNLAVKSVSRKLANRLYR